MAGIKFNPQIGKKNPNDKIQQILQNPGNPPKKEQMAQQAPQQTPAKRTYPNAQGARQAYANRTAPQQSSQDRIRAAMQQSALRGQSERKSAENSSYVKNLKKQAASKAREAAMSKRGG